MAGGVLIPPFPDTRCLLDDNRMSSRIIHTGRLGLTDLVHCSFSINGVIKTVVLRAHHRSDIPKRFLSKRTHCCNIDHGLYPRQDVKLICLPRVGAGDVGLGENTWR